MRIPGIQVVGNCSHCKHETAVERDSLCAAACSHNFKGRRCKGSGYSVNNIRFVIPTEEEAQAVAAFLRDNAGSCFGPYRCHSPACGDGRRCEETWAKLARAFAIYYLTHRREESGTKKAA